MVETVVPAHPSSDARNPITVEHSKKGMGALIAWIVIPVLLAVFVLVVFFFLPGMKANMIENDGMSPGQPKPDQSQNR